MKIKTFDIKTMTVEEVVEKLNEIFARSGYKLEISNCGIGFDNNTFIIEGNQRNL